VSPSREPASTSLPPKPLEVSSQAIQEQSGSPIRERVLFIEARYDVEKDSLQEVVLDKATIGENKPPSYNDHAFVWKRIFDKGESDSHIEIVIGDVELKNLLAYNLRDLPGHRDGEQMTFYQPFFPLVLSWQRLQDVANRKADEEVSVAQDDLKLLLELLEGSKRLKPYFDALENYTKDKTMAWEFLWTIFPPGHLIFATPFNVPQAFLVADCDFTNIDQDEEEVVVYCWTYGSTFSRLSPFKQVEFTDRERQNSTGRSFDATITASILASTLAPNLLTRCHVILWNSMRTPQR
jgi:hypothetical protein